jgi:hypothetical protein
MIDHLSEEMRKAYPGRPAEGESRTYKLAGIRKNPTKEGGMSFVMPNSRSLPSSYPVLDEGRPKNIVFVKGQTPTEDPSKTLQQLGYVEFRREDSCTIRVTHDNYVQTMYIDMFLFFSPYIVGANEKPWYLKAKEGMFIVLERPEDMAADFLDIDQLIHQAKTVVYGFNKDMLGIVVDQLKLGHSARMSEKEMRQKLIQYCDARIKNTPGAGAKRILSLTENSDVTLRKLIKAATKLEKIRIGDSQTEWVWVNGGEAICPKLPSKTLEDSLIMFFMSDDGREVLGTLKNMVKDAAEKMGAPKAAPAKQEVPTALSDEFGPIKGSPEWDELTPNQKGEINKKRKRAEEIAKDTTIPETPVVV